MSAKRVRAEGEEEAKVADTGSPSQLAAHYFMERYTDHPSPDRLLPVPEAAYRHLCVAKAGIDQIAKLPDLQLLCFIGATHTKAAAEVREAGRVWDASFDHKNMMVNLFSSGHPVMFLAANWKTLSHACHNVHEYHQYLKWREMEL